jgi:DNA polymerase I
MSLPRQFERFEKIIALDFEFSCPPGESPEPHCLVAIDVCSGYSWRVFCSQVDLECPYPTDSKTLIVSYFASAEIGCHLKLGFPVPENILDLYVEFRNLTNNASSRQPSSLLNALTYFGLESIDSVEKDEMRDLAMRGGPFRADEREALLNYCESDVKALLSLFKVMAPKIDLPRAMYRGRYMAQLAVLEANGIPINGHMFRTIKTYWEQIQASLITRVDSNFGVYEGRSFRQKAFANYLFSRGIRWPKLPSGRMDLRDETFKSICHTFPELSPLRELRTVLSKLRLSDLSVGKDSRNRCLLSPFASKTGRNQPSNSRFIFGPAVWLRCLIQPEPGNALAYVDWEQQEFGIAAALAGDGPMMNAYSSADPYLTFAKQAGAVPEDATKKSHKNERERFKQACLAVQYGMGAASLSSKLGQSTAYGKHLLNLHKRTYHKFWLWQERVFATALHRGFMETTYGWKMRVGRDYRARTLANFPVQANGAEMLRIAIILAGKAGIKVCAPVHDALLVEGPIDDIGHVVWKAQQCMEQASQYVLGGFKLRSDADIIKHPTHYSDPRGLFMWEQVNRALAEVRPA